MRSADEGVARWSAICQFSGGSSLRDQCRVKRVENGMSVDGTDCEIRRTRVNVNVTGEKKKKKGGKEQSQECGQLMMKK